MNKVLILFAHPLFEKSRIHQALVRAIPNSPSITFRDLYELYPDFNVDIKEEKKVLLDHDIIIWQHPVYWYSVPPLLKQWIDMVLEFGWAYGPGGDALSGKKIFNVISAGGQQAVYSPGGRNRFTIRQFLAPLEQTATLCKMHYLAPFVVHGTHSLTKEQIALYATNYRILLVKLVEHPVPVESLSEADYMNAYIEEAT